MRASVCTSDEIYALLRTTLWGFIVQRTLHSKLHTRIGHELSLRSQSACSAPHSRMCSLAVTSHSKRNMLPAEWLVGPDGDCALLEAGVREWQRATEIIERARRDRRIRVGDELVGREGRRDAGAGVDEIGSAIHSNGTLEPRIGGQKRLRHLIGEGGAPLLGAECVGGHAERHHGNMGHTIEALLGKIRAK